MKTNEAREYFHDEHRAQNASYNDFQRILSNCKLEKGTYKHVPLIPDGDHTFHTWSVNTIFLQGKILLRWSTVIWQTISFVQQYTCSLSELKAKYGMVYRNYDVTYIHSVIYLLLKRE